MASRRRVIQAIVTLRHGPHSGPDVVATTHVGDTEPLAASYHR